MLFGVKLLCLHRFELMKFYLHYVDMLEFEVLHRNVSFLFCLMEFRQLKMVAVGVIVELRGTDRTINRLLSYEYAGCNTFIE